MHLAPGQFSFKLTTTPVGASSHHEGGDATGATIKAIPQPLLLFLVLHKRPLLIHLQRLDARRHARLLDLCRSQTQDFENRVGAHSQNTRGVSNATAVERHRNDQFPQVRHPSPVAIAQGKQKLLTASLTAVSLLLLTCCAILLDVARATLRADYFFSLHTL